MSSTSTDLVERLYRRLVETARERYGELRSPLTIGDLYQELIPYRGVRADLGVFELAQYENALVRLLAGEGGYLRLTDEHVRRELAAELSSPNPILGIYRDYPTQPVALTAADGNPRSEVPGAGGAAVERDAADHQDSSIRSIDDLVAEEDGDQGWADGEDEDPEAGGEEAGRGGVAALPELDYPAPRPLPADATRVDRSLPPEPAVSIQRKERAERCVSCGESLPEVEDLRYCPQCGTDQIEVPCEHCGTPVRSTWNFCIRCGAHRPRPRPPV